MKESFHFMSILQWGLNSVSSRLSPAPDKNGEIHHYYTEVVWEWVKYIDINTKKNEDFKFTDF